MNDRLPSRPALPLRAVGAAALGLLIGALAACASGERREGATIPDEIARVLDQPRYRDATWALRVVDLDRGTVLADLHADRRVLLGSVRKLFSVGLALDALGPEHRIRTPVFRRGTVDAAGVLDGDLILVARGDLTMGGRTNPDGSLAVSDFDHNEANTLGAAVLTAPDPLAGYRALARQVAASGITRVSGDVIVDDRLFEPFDFRGEFQVRPIFVNDNVVDAVVPSAAGCAGFGSRPVSAAFRVECRLQPVAAGGAFRAEPVPALPTCIGTRPCSGQLTGTLPADFVPPLTNRYPLVRTFRITEPANYARTVLIEALAAAGVSVAAPPVAANRAGDLPPAGGHAAASQVAELVSPPFRETARYVLKVSYNLGADTSLMLFGLTQGTRTLEGALAAERAALSARPFGIAADQVQFADGSGGGDAAATTPAVLRMLQVMSQTPSFAAYRAALPRLGVDGSLAFVTDFQRDAALAGATGRVHAKTGTYVTGTAQGPVLRAQSLAGYIDARSGRRLAFALVVNDVGPIAGIEAILPVFQDQGTVAAMLWHRW